MSASDVNPKSVVRVDHAGPAPDFSPVYYRSGDLGCQVMLSIVPTKHLLADEGTYCLATFQNFGVDSGLPEVIRAASGFDTTSPILILANLESARPGRRLYIDYIRLLPLGSASDGTLHGVVQTDMVSRLGGLVVANAKTATLTQPNTDSANVPPVAAYGLIGFGNLPITGPSQQQTMSHFIMHNIGSNGGDEYVISFGEKWGQNPGIGSGFKASIHNHCPPVVVGPGDMLLFFDYADSGSTYITGEIEVGFWVR